MKRILAITLAAVMLFAFCPALTGLRADAAEPAKTEAKAAEKKAEKLPIEGEYTLFALESNPQIAELREMLTSGAMNELAVSLLKDRTGLCSLTLRPSKDLGERKRRAEKARLERITSEWTEEEKKTNEKLLDSLQAWQETPDSPEALATLPMLKKEDADIPPEWPETEMLMEKGVPVLFHAQPTSGIVYLRAYFP